MHAYTHQQLNPTSSSRLAASPPPPPPPSSRGTMTGSPSSHIWGYVSPLFAGCLTWQSFMCVTWLVYVCGQPMFHGSWLIQVYGHFTSQGTFCTSQLSCRHCSLHRMLDMAIVHVCNMTCFWMSHEPWNIGEWVTNHEYLMNVIWFVYVCGQPTFAGIWPTQVCGHPTLRVRCARLLLRGWLVCISF